MNVIYTAIATATGDGRASGRAVSDDAALDVAIAAPVALGGSGAGTNPEQLFAAGWATCFHSALKTVAKGAGVTLQDTAVVAEIGLGTHGDGTYGIQATLHVEIGGGVDQATGDQLVARAHEVCPYSNATRGNVEVTLTTTVAA